MFFCSFSQLKSLFYSYSTLKNPFQEKNGEVKKSITKETIKENTNNKSFFLIHLVEKV